MEHWSIAKPAVHAQGGVVVSQHYLAAQAGARVLEQGGNAIDAAIAAGFALGAVEPWMSGIGRLRLHDDLPGRHRQELCR